MGWDDSAPTAKELAPSSSSWDSAPPAKEELGSIPWSDVPKNTVHDVKGIVHGMADQGKRFLDPTGLGEAVSSGSIEPIERAASEPLHQIKGFWNQIKDTATHPIETFKKQPVSTSLLAAPLFGLGGEEPIVEPEKPFSEPLPESPPAPSPAAPSEPKPETLSPEHNSSTPPSTSELFESAKSKMPHEILEPAEALKQYLQKQYGEISKKPGMGNVAADYLKEHSRNMALKEMGAAPGQVRKIGVDQAHALADYAEKNGLVGPKIGTIGREKLVASRLHDAGGAVGAFRKIASDRGAVTDIGDLTNQIKSKLDQKYLTPGMYSGQKGTYLKGLAELKKTSGNAVDLSGKVTEMFKEAKNQNPLGKPTGPLADIAREVRSINHASISKALTPQEMALYEKSLEDYGALTQIHEFVKRRGSTEAGGRLGPGSGISRAAVQKFLDSFGYRAEAKIASKLSDFIRSHPEALTKPKDIFRNYVDEAAEAIHEMGDVPH